MHCRGSYFARGFKSKHPGGGNFCFADGSVKFIKNSIDPYTYNAIGSRAGGEVVAPKRQPKNQLTRPDPPGVPAGGSGPRPRLPSRKPRVCRHAPEQSPGRVRLTHPARPRTSLPAGRDGPAGFTPK